MSLEMDKLMDITPTECIALGAALSASAAVMWTLKHQLIQEALREVDKNRDDAEARKQEVRKLLIAFIEKQTEMIVPPVTEAAIGATGVGLISKANPDEIMKMIPMLL